jgi:hypothetical protein
LIEGKNDSFKLSNITTETIQKSVLLSYVTEEEWETQKQKSTETKILENDFMTMEEESMSDDEAEDDKKPNQMAILAAKKKRELRRHMEEIAADDFIAFEEDGKEGTTRHVREEDEIEELDEGRRKFNLTLGHT